jgi:DNA-binding NtrC family response regulator
MYTAHEAIFTESEVLMHQGRILLVDDDDRARDFLKAFLNYKGYQVMEACDAHEALALLNQNEFDLVFTDLMMPRVNGLEFLKKLKAVRPDIVTIVCSAYSTNEMVASLLKAGAFFCLNKPFNLEEIETHVRRSLEHRMLQSRDFKGKPTVKNRSLMGNIVGESNKILSLLELVEKVAESDATVLIQGESGTGKELFARAIHDLSTRKSRNFIPVNSAAIPEDLLESELFGHMKGAFTGAVANRIGRFEMADKGSIFLDEIGDMRLSLQVKLLRVLQNREIEPVGGMQLKKIDTRFIAATNQNLEKLVEEKTFREDLFYRLSVIPIVIPPLRERHEDIPLLVENFVRRMGCEKKTRITGVDRGAMAALCDYQWPGNIRELENLIERLVIIKGSGIITSEDLPDKYAGKVARKAPEQVDLSSGGICFNTAMEEFENRLISEALQKSGGNKKEAAQMLNLKRTTLIEKLKKKNLFPEMSLSAS